MKLLFKQTLLSAACFSLIIFGACKSKPKDADIKTAIETALKADPSAAGTMVTVEKGVATITGVCADEMCKTKCAEIVKGIKGVKEVVNNCTIAPAPEPVVIADDSALSQGLMDALKDVAGVKGQVTDGKIVLKGEIAKAKWAALKQLLDKLKPKGYDLTALIIK